MDELKRSVKSQCDMIYKLQVEIAKQEEQNNPNNNNNNNFSSPN